MGGVMSKIKSKLESLLTSILPYLREQVSKTMGEPIEVMIVAMDSKGDAMGISHLPDEVQMMMLDGLLKQKLFNISLKQVH
jgi:hypothetical protein